MKNKLKKVYESGKICGLTLNNGNKHNGQILTLSGNVVTIYDRNQKENVSMPVGAIKELRCG